MDRNKNEKKMNELISVIVPIYNTEKYIIKCLDSIKNQKYTNLEILLIDDGSTDNSFMICQKYCKENEKFKLFHKKNEGVSKARNYGIEKSIGKYIIFIDSDDTISEDMILNLYDNIIKNDADISMCNITRVKENGEEIIEFGNNKKNKTEIKVLDKTEYIANLLDSKGYYTYATNKLIKAEIIKNVRFKEDIYYNEDGLFFLEIAENISKAVFISPVKFYFYLSNENSANGQAFNERFLTVIKSFEIMEEFFDEFNYKNKCYFAYRYIMYTIEANYYLFINNKIGKIKNDTYINITRKYFRYAIMSDNLSCNIKIKFVLKLFFPNFINKIKNKIKKIRSN